MITHNFMKYNSENYIDKYFCVKYNLDNNSNDYYYGVNHEIFKTEGYNFKKCIKSI